MAKEIEEWLTDRTLIAEELSHELSNYLKKHLGCFFLDQLYDTLRHKLQNIDGDHDLFCHHEHIQMGGFRKLEKDQVVSFVIGENDKGAIATDIQVENG